MNANKIALAIDLIARLSSQKPQPVIQQAMNNFYSGLTAQLRTLLCVFDKHATVFSAEEVAQIREYEAFLAASLQIPETKIERHYNYTDDGRNAFPHANIQKASSPEYSRNSSPARTDVDESPMAGTGIACEDNDPPRKRRRRQRTQQVSIAEIMRSLRSSLKESNRDPGRETMENPDTEKTYAPAEITERLKTATAIINKLHRTTLRQAFIFGSWLDRAKRTFLQYRDQYETNSFIAEASRITTLHKTQLYEYSRFFRCFKDFPRIANCALPLSYFGSGVAERIYAHLKENHGEAAYWSSSTSLVNANVDVTPKQEAVDNGRFT